MKYGEGVPGGGDGLTKAWGSERSIHFSPPFHRARPLGLGWVMLRTQPPGLVPNLRRLPVQDGSSDRGWAPWAPRPLTRLFQALAPALVLEAAPLPLHSPEGRVSIRAEPPSQHHSVLPCLLLCVFPVISPGPSELYSPPTRRKRDYNSHFTEGKLRLGEVVRFAQAPCWIRLTPGGTLLPQLPIPLTTAPYGTLGLRML